MFARIRKFFYENFEIGPIFGFLLAASAPVIMLTWPLLVTAIGSVALSAVAMVALAAVALPIATAIFTGIAKLPSLIEFLREHSAESAFKKYDSDDDSDYSPRKDRPAFAPPVEKNKEPSFKQEPNNSRDSNYATSNESESSLRKRY